MLIAELLDAGGQMNILGHDRVFPRFDSAYRISIPADDMRLIASHVELEQWADVMGAIVATNGLATFVNSQIEHGRQVLTASEACYRASTCALSPSPRLRLLTWRMLPARCRR
jgi:hypothetical protein